MGVCILAIASGRSVSLSKVRVNGQAGDDGQVLET